MARSDSLPIYGLILSTLLNTLRFTSVADFDHEHLHGHEGLFGANVVEVITFGARFEHDLTCSG